MSAFKAARRQDDDAITDDDDALTMLFDRALNLGVMSVRQVHALGDAVESGGTSAAELLALSSLLTRGFNMGKISHAQIGTHLDAVAAGTSNADALLAVWGPRIDGEAEDEEGLRAYLAANFQIVSQLGGDGSGGLYVCCMKEADAEVHAACVAHFERLLASPECGDLRAAVGQHFVFAVGPDGRQLERRERAVERRFGKYVMSMKLDWPYEPGFEPGFGASELAGFVSSCWRPAGYCATIEETFHTVTEACNRLQQEGQHPRFAGWDFGPAGVLGRAMQADIDAGSYDTEEQNREEGGDYDFVTAVNEWVHQVWAVYVAGHEEMLNAHRQVALELMLGTPGFPLLRATRAGGAAGDGDGGDGDGGPEDEGEDEDGDDAVVEQEGEEEALFVLRRAGGKRAGAEGEASAAGQHGGAHGGQGAAGAMDEDEDDTRQGDDDDDDEGSASGRGGGGALPAGASIGIIIDLHYLQVAASTFSLSTTWSVADFEAALVAACGGGPVTCRFACDSEMNRGVFANAGWGKGGGKGGGKGSGKGGGKNGSPFKSEHGKKRLHAQLTAAGYTLVTSPNKGSGARGQGATDIDVAVCLFEAAGAFAEAPVARTLALVAGDADFRPALARVAAARPELRLAVVAQRTILARHYAAWVAAQPQLAHVELSALLGVVAGGGVVDLRGEGRPRAANGRANAFACAKLAEDAAAALGAPPGSGGGGDHEAVTLNVSGFGEPAWGDAETENFVAALLGETGGGFSSAAARLGGLWIHHTEIGDASCASLARLLPAVPMLNELHVSDSAVSAAGLRLLGEACRATGHSPSKSRGNRGRLYVNARHLGGAAAEEVAVEFSDVAVIKIERAGGGGGPGSPGSGAKWGKGGKGGSSPVGNATTRSPKKRASSRMGRAALNVYHLRGNAAHDAIVGSDDARVNELVAMVDALIPKPNRLEFEKARGRGKGGGRGAGKGGGKGGGRGGGKGGGRGGGKGGGKGGKGTHKGKGQQHVGRAQYF